MIVPRRYGLLRAIAGLLKLLAWVALLLGLAIGVASLVAGGTLLRDAPTLVAPVRMGGLVFGLLAGIIWFVQLYAFGSILTLLVDIEQNTRALAALPPVEESAVEYPVMQS